MSQKEKQIPYISRDISWLSFNERVLQEASDKTVPLLERIKFLAIFSNNRDEFFRVRVANVKKLLDIGKKAKGVIGEDPAKVMNQIQEIVVKQQINFEKIYSDIIKELESHNIFLVNENQLNKSQSEVVWEFYHSKVRPRLVPIIIEESREFPYLKDKGTYLYVRLKPISAGKKSVYAIVEVPTTSLSRFLVLPKKGEKNYIIMLDDVIRHCMNNLFAIIDHKGFDAYNIKLTRDAEFEITPDINESYLDKISKGVKERMFGEPVRMVYDSTMPKEMQKFLIKSLKLTNDDTLVPGGRYHNFKDFINFPDLGIDDMKYESFPPLPHKDLTHQKSWFKTLDEKDILITYPYQSFGHIIDLLREAAIDTHVRSIKISLYRVSKDSSIVNALINAVKNGKSVTAVVELQARFDEENNIYWANEMQQEGVKVIYDIPGLKVHAKAFIITRVIANRTKVYGHVGTGNFNESTSRIYSDFSLLTADRRITNDLEKVFYFLERNFMPHKFRHLLISPFYMRNQIEKLIDFEIKQAKEKKESFIVMKLNSISDQEMIKKLYEASKAGVKVKLIIRGICSLVTEMKGFSDNIEVYSIVDRFLEHARVYQFCNAGNDKIYLSSADIMSRNLDHRVEAAIPIYDEKLKKLIRKFLDIQFNGNVKVRIINKQQTNPYRRPFGDKPFRAQYELYNYFKERLEQSE